MSTPLIGNTVSDFKVTSKRHSITCPSCGGNIGIHIPGSFRLVFTPTYCHQLGDRIDELRLFTSNLESLLANKVDAIPLTEFESPPHEGEEEDFIKHSIREANLVTDNPSDTDPHESQNEGSPRVSKENRLLTQGLFPDDSLAAKLANNFVKTLDPFNLIELIALLPSMPNATATGDAANEDAGGRTKVAAKSYARALTGTGLEPRHLGLLFELIFEQPPFRERRGSEYYTQHKPVIDRIVSTVCPALARYHSFVEQHIEHFDAKVRGDIRANLVRARMLLLVLHGHSYRVLAPTRGSDTEESQHDDVIATFTSEKFGLPNDAHVPPELLRDLVKSRVFLGQKTEQLLGLPSVFVTLVRSLISMYDQIKRLLKSEPAWLEYVGEFVTVQCQHVIEVDLDDFVKEKSETKEKSTKHQRGLITYAERLLTECARQFDLFTKHPRGASSSEPDRPARRRAYIPCLFTPNRANSHPIITIGSAGTGKTCLLVSGLTKLLHCQGLFDFVLLDEDYMTAMEIGKIQMSFQTGELKKRTEIPKAFKLQLIGTGAHRGRNARFAINDIPGEFVTLLMQGSGAVPELRRRLRNVETIVFQFDLLSHLFVFHYVEMANKIYGGVFDALLQDCEKNQAEREESKGYFSDQIKLLGTFLELLEEERGAESLRQVNFVCVFSKCDAFIAPDEASRRLPCFFLTEFADRLREMKILVPADVELRDSSNPTSFRECHTMAGAGATDGKNGDVIEHQIDLCRRISELAESELRRITDLLPEHALNDRKTLKEGTIEKVFDMLEGRFREVFYLPVSALGVTPTPEQKDASSLDKSPNSILSEYVFLLPMLLALENRSKSSIQKASAS